jgi:hypothetical protein
MAARHVQDCARKQKGETEQPAAGRVLPFALRGSLRLVKIAPGDFVSLHAGVAAKGSERDKIEHLAR